MSQTVIFIVGVFVFMITVWGVVVSGGIWLGRIAEAEDTPSQVRPAFDVVEDLASPPES